MPRWQRQGSRWVRQPSTTFFEMATAPLAVAGDGDALGTPTTPPRNAGAMANAPTDSPPAPPPAPVPARRYATRNVSPDASSGVQADPEGPQGAFVTPDSFAMNYYHYDEIVEDNTSEFVRSEFVREAARLDENMTRGIASRARLLAPLDEDRDVELLRRRVWTLLSDDELRQVLRSNGNDVLASVLEIGGSVENGRVLLRTSPFLVGDFPRIRQPFFPEARVPDPVANPVSALHGRVCAYIDHVAAKDIPDSDKAPSEFTCPLSLHAMLNPVRCSDGKVYDCAHINSWRQSPSFNGTSPLTRAELTPDQTECTALVNEMAEWACGKLGLKADDSNALAARLERGPWVPEPAETRAEADADVDMEAGEAQRQGAPEINLGAYHNVAESGRMFGWQAGIPPPLWADALRPVVQAQVGNGVTEDEINNMLLVTDGDAAAAIRRLRGLARARWMRNADRPPPDSEAVNQIPEHDLPLYVDGADYVGTRGVVHLYWIAGVRVQPLPAAPPRPADDDVERLERSDGMEEVH